MVCWQSFGGLRGIGTKYLRYVGAYVEEEIRLAE